MKNYYFDEKKYILFKKEIVKDLEYKVNSLYNYLWYFNGGNYIKTNYFSKKEDNIIKYIKEKYKEIKINNLNFNKEPLKENYNGTIIEIKKAIKQEDNTEYIIVQYQMPNPDPIEVDYWTFKDIKQNGIFKWNYMSLETNSYYTYNKEQKTFDKKDDSFLTEEIIEHISKCKNFSLGTTEDYFKSFDEDQWYIYVDTSFENNKIFKYNFINKTITPILNYDNYNKEYKELLYGEIDDQGNIIFYPIIQKKYIENKEYYLFNTKGYLKENNSENDENNVSYKEKKYIYLLNKDNKYIEITSIGGYDKLVYTCNFDYSPLKKSNNINLRFILREDVMSEYWNNQTYFNKNLYLVRYNFLETIDKIENKKYYIMGDKIEGFYKEGDQNKSEYYYGDKTIIDDFYYKNEKIIFDHQNDYNIYTPTIDNRSICIYFIQDNISTLIKENDFQVRLW